MKRLSLILILAILIATFSFSTVFARSDSPGAAGPTVQASNLARNGCWGADLQGQVKFGRLYAGPGFNMTRFLRENRSINGSRMVLDRGTSVNGCAVWILPSE